MSLSFKDSLKANIENNVATTKHEIIEPVATMNIDEPSIDNVGIMTLDENYGIAAYSGDDGNWEQHPDYVYYSTFSDDNISIIDDKKDINLDGSQFNITQEENSQYIPFEMPRYYDGYDLIRAEISIHYTTKSGRHGASKPVNVTFNNNKIRFGWLVDAGATLDVGTLEFEIHAYGTVTGNDGVAKAYTWKTKRNKDLIVYESMCDCEDVINNIDDTWLQELVTDIAKNIADEIKNVSVGEQVEEAKRYANEASEYADEARQSANNASTAATNAVKAILSDYATTEYVDEAVAGVDVAEQLASYVKTEDLETNYYTKTDAEQRVSNILEDYATKEDVSTAITEADISSKLENYYTKEETYNKTEIDSALDNVSVDLTGYATEKFVTDKTDILSGAVSTNTEDISTLSKTVGDLQSDVNSIDKSPRLTYDVVYNDTEDKDVGENVFVFYEIENEGKENEVREAKKKFTIVGGSGGGGTSSSLKIGYVTTSPLVVTINDRAIIKYTFSGTDSSGDAVPEGVATWKVAGTTVATSTALNGENSFDITDYLSVGTQKVNLSIVDEAGSLVTKPWTVQKIDVRIESTFNDKFTYPIGTISFDYTPYGAISKDVHFVLDGKEIGKVTTASSGIPMAYEIPSQTHGSHLLEVYMTSEINGNAIESNHIVKDIMWYNASTPVISCTQQNITALQYDNTNIVFTCIDPTTETPTVELAVDGIVQSTLTLESNTHTWQFKSSEIGKHTLTIKCGEIVKTLYVTIEKLDINVEPITAGLVFDFNPSGKSNNDTDRLWSYGDTNIGMTVSDNFDWVNGGYQIDENGDQYFCIKAGTSAEISYHLFADDAKKNGKEVKLVFKTNNVAVSDAQFLSCVDNTTGSDHIGVEMFVRHANIYGGTNEYLRLPLAEKKIIELEFNINKNTEAITEMCGYEDGVSSKHLVYDDSFNFTQQTPKYITLGSNDCDLHIYRFKVYNTSLNGKNVLSNYIADARNADEMVKRYNRNQIYDENGALTAETLADACKQLRIIKLESPYFTNKKSDKVNNSTFTHIYKNGDVNLDNWKATNSVSSGQGTSSDNYGGAARNLDLIMQEYKDYGNKPVITLNDGTVVDKIALTRNSIPVDYFNIKVNVASSNMFTNAGMAKRYNKFNPYKRPFVREDESEIEKIKDTMDFYPCVVFIKESDPDINTHREFADTDWHFYSMGCIGDSKKTDKTRLTDPNDRYECIVEIMDVELPLSDFPKDTMMNAMGYKTDEATSEKIYTWAKDENLDILYEKIDGEYVLTQDETVDLTKTYYVDILEHDDFSEDYTYGWRYLWEDGTDEENEEVANYCHQKWNEFYRFATTSTDEEFKAHLEDYMVVDSAIYYYLFTTRYTLVDNRAKNSFWHYGWTGEYDESGEKIRKWDLSFAYDMDTSLGLNNYGDLVYRYGYEDTDTLDGTNDEVFRESDSTFFCRIRDLFKDRQKTMYNSLESQGAWSSVTLLQEIEEWQSAYPEALWYEHIKKLYIDSYNSTFINGAGDQQFLRNMAHGKCKYAFIDYETNQEPYMASKYQSSFASSDNSVFRCTVPTGDLVVQPNYKLKLTPYSYMYLNVKYGTQSPIQVRAVPNVEYEIPFEGDSTDIIDVFSSSNIKSFGDLSSCYAATIDTAKASRIKELIIGNKTEGYDNPYLTTLTTGANYLLEILNIENVSGLTQALNLSAMQNLKELYAHGSNIGGVTFANGGKIEIAELPAINSATMKNLIYLTTLDITDLSKLTTLTVENCNTVDLVAIFNSAPNLNRIRIIGVDWTLEDTSLLERLYNMSGIDKDGYNADKSVLSGTVTVPTIGQYELYKYEEAWSDLTIIPKDGIIPQYKVTFKNYDGTELDVQYIDQYGSAVDPITREENPILTPTKESSIQYSYVYSGWDTDFSNIVMDIDVYATYEESLREYTIQYVSMGTPVKTVTGFYGDNIVYDGDIPTYTAAEPTAFYLFNRWDKSGFLTDGFDSNGVKTVTAIFDKFTGNSTYFNGKELSDLSPVEIYAMTKLGISESVITDKDPYSFTIGNDVDYDDIESELLISEKTSFTGSNYVDTGIQLFDEDKDFVLAIDYEFLSGNKSNAVLAQCYQANGSNGFKLWYSSASGSSGVNLTWGTTSNNVVGTNRREIIVIRHKKGNNNLTIYKSNLDGNEVLTVDLARTKSTIGTGTLVFGCAKADDGYYENHAIGNINWAKVWFADLGDDVCKDLAAWTHESITLEACGFRKYYLTENTSKRCSFSLLASHLLGRTKRWNIANTNDGGWAESELNKSLNTRLYSAMPIQVRQLMKQVIVYSNDGITNTSVTPNQYYTEVTPSNCYITIPAIIEVDSSQNAEPYNSEGTAISYMVNNDARKRAFDGGDYNAYWLRSPSTGWANYIWRVETGGDTQAITNAQTELGVLIEISF